MAMSRCQNCGKSTKNVKEVYKASVYPIGYPDTAVICGKEGCQFPGLVWLTAKDLSDYEKGKRIFKVHTNTVKVKVI